jgi:hypothetical protein
MQVAQNPGQ